MITIVGHKFHHRRTQSAVTTKTTVYDDLGEIAGLFESGIPAKKNAHYKVVLSYSNHSTREGSIETSDNIRDGSSEKPFLIVDFETVSGYAPIDLSDFTLDMLNGNTAYTTKEMLDKNFRLYENINMSKQGNWTPVAVDFVEDSYSTPYFSGIFDGNNKIIKGLTVNDAIYAGLFGAIIGGTIKNLGMEDVNITGTGYAGGIVARETSIKDFLENMNSRIENCYVTGNVSGEYAVGGILGASNDRITIENCYFSGNIIGDHSVGGIVGNNNGGTIESCYFSGTISGVNTIGGIAGNGGIVKNCYTTGNINGIENQIGGIMGQGSGTIQNCYSTADVSGDYEVGGIVGRGDGSGTTIEHCYALNGSITVTNFGVGRIIGSNGNTTYNYALETMLVNGSTVPGGNNNSNDGENISKEDAIDSILNHYESNTWDFSNIWVFDYTGYDVGTEANLPILKTVSGRQNPYITAP